MSSLNRETTTAMLNSVPSSSGVAPFSPTSRASEQVTQLVFLGFQVTRVVRVRRDLDRHAFDHLEAKTFQPVDLLGIVGQESNLAHAQVVQDLAADAVVTLV